MFGGYRCNGTVNKSRAYQWTFKTMFSEGKRDRWRGTTSPRNERTGSQYRRIDYIPPIYMVVGMRNTCILGADFFKSGRMVVDIANSKLTWPSGEVALVIETTAPTVNKLNVLLDNYSDIFVSGPNDPLGRTTLAEHAIDTGDSRPVK